MPVTIQHDITDHKDARLFKGWYMYLHYRQYGLNLIKRPF